MEFLHIRSQSFTPLLNYVLQQDRILRTGFDSLKLCLESCGEFRKRIDGGNFLNNVLAQSVKVEGNILHMASLVAL